MNHSFDIAHACAYGIHEAILIQNLQFWIVKNRANGRHAHGGRTWTYSSVNAFTELFPYMSTSAMRRTLLSLQRQGVILTGNYNSNQYDRTSWFAFADEAVFLPAFAHLSKTTNGVAEGDNSICRKRQMELSKPTNGVVETDKSHTDVRTDVKKDGGGEHTHPSPPPLPALKQLTTEQPDSRLTKKDQQPTTEQPNSQQPTTEQPNSQQPTTEQPTANSQQPNMLQALIDAVDVQRVANSKKPLTKLDIKKIEQEAKAAGIDAAAALNWVLESPTRNFFKFDYYTPAAAEAPPVAPVAPPPEPLSKEEQEQRKAARAAAAAAAAEEEERLSGIWDYNKKLVGPKWAIDLVNDYLSGKLDIDNSSIKRFDACKILGVKEKALLAAHNDACAAIEVMSENNDIFCDEDA